MTQPFEFTCHNRSQRTVVILICIYGVLIGLVIVLGAAWWLMALLALPTLPAVWDVARNTSAGMRLDGATLSWFTGNRQGKIPLSRIDRFRFDTRWDFTVRVSVILESGKRVRLPDESLPPHRDLEQRLHEVGFTVERHHFRVF